METAEQLAERVANGHAFEMHVQRKREFESANFGTPVPIATREDFKTHVQHVLESTETLCCTVFTELSSQRPTDVYYHPSTNTIVIVPENPKSEPTAFRPQDGFVFFCSKAEESGGLGNQVDVVHSIYELHPELAQEKERERIRLADRELRLSIEKRFERERSDLLMRHAMELERSVDIVADKSRHADELRALSSRKEEDFQRYRQERENALQLQSELRKREREQQLKEGKEFRAPRRR
jgi:hypothetical protein